MVACVCCLANVDALLYPWASQVTHPGADGVEPFMKDGMDLFSLFLKPSTDWVQR